MIGIDRSRALQTAVLLILGGVAPWGFLAAPTLFTDRSFAFRDGAHFYPPLLHEVHRQWDEGRMPLWNACEERGRPLWADPTAAVLYPGQLIFRLPIPFRQAYEWYVWGHVALAGTTMYFCARRRKLVPTAAAFAGISYAFGGSILFQTCNLPYLISAAWLPWGISAAIDNVYYPGWRAQLRLAAAIALVTLGGDPQAAYLLGLAVCLLLLLSLRRIVRHHGVRTATCSALPLLASLVLAGAFAIGLTAAQWLPTLVWSRQSERVMAPADTRQAEGGRAIAEPIGEHSRRDERPISYVPVQDHATARYQFSIGPWRWMELAWPNAGGQMFPIHRRWMTAIPAEGRCWTPSLYMGLATFLLGFAQMRLRDERMPVCWLSWIALLGILASLGMYGIGWAVGEIRLAIGHETNAATAPWGGLYWLMNQTLPGFHLFRYPAKLWTWTSLALSLLAAWGIHDRLEQRRPLFPRRVLFGYGVLSVTLTAATIVAEPWLVRLLHQVPPDPLFGPLDTQGVMAGLRQSLLHATILATLYGLLCGSWPLLARHPARVGGLIAVLTAWELCAAHAWMTPTVAEIVLDTVPALNGPPATFNDPTARDDTFLSDHLTFRVPPRTWYPGNWAAKSDPHRVQDCVAWDIATARPKHPLYWGQAALRSSTSFSTRDQRALLTVIDDLWQHDRNSAVRLLEILGVRHVVLPADESVQSIPSLTAVPTPTQNPRFASWAAWHRTRSPFPRAWFVSQKNAVTMPDDAASQEELVVRTRDVFLPKQQIRSLRDHVVLETESSHARNDARNSRAPRVLANAISTQQGHQTNPAQCRVLHQAAGEIRIRIDADQPGYVVVNQSYAAGWRADRIRQGGIDTDASIPVLRANRVMIAVAVPAGSHELRFKYRPDSVRIGLLVSSLTLVLIGGYTAWHATRDARVRAATPS